MTDPIATPNFAAKAALVTGRAIQKPFEVPAEFTASAHTLGGVAHNVVGSFASTARAGIEALQPRGFVARMFEGAFNKVDLTLDKNASQAMKATEMFWKPFSEGSQQIGLAAANPFAMFYATRAGFELPSEPDAVRDLLKNQILDPEPPTRWPAPAPADEPPAGDVPPSGEEPPAGDVPPSDEVPPGSDTPPSDDAPPSDDTPAPGDEVPGDKPPTGEEPPAGETPPPGEEPPAGETPPTDDAPPADDAPPSDEAPPVDDAPPSGEAPPTGEKPPAEDTPPGTAPTEPSPEEIAEIEQALREQLGKAIDEINSQQPLDTVTTGPDADADTSSAAPVADQTEAPANDAAKLMLDEDARPVADEVEKPIADEVSKPLVEDVPKPIAE